MSPNKTKTTPQKQNKNKKQTKQNIRHHFPFWEMRLKLAITPTSCLLSRTQVSTNVCLFVCLFVCLCSPFFPSTSLTSIHCIEFNAQKRLVWYGWRSCCDCAAGCCAAAAPSSGAVNLVEPAATTRAGCRDACCQSQVPLR